MSTSATLINEEKHNHDEMRKYICDFIDDLTHDDIVSIFRLLNSRISENMFKKNAAGCSVNLDKVSDNIIVQTYNLVVQKQNEF